MIHIHKRPVSWGTGVVTLKMDQLYILFILGNTKIVLEILSLNTRIGNISFFFRHRRVKRVMILLSKSRDINLLNVKPLFIIFNDRFRRAKKKSEIIFF